MGELRTADHVADGIDAAIGGLQLVVHLDAVGIVFHAGAFEAQGFEVWLAAGGDQQMAAFDEVGLTVLDDMDGDALHRPLDLFHSAVRVERDLRLLQALDHDACGLGVLVDEELRRVDDGDMGAEHAMGLAELDADGTAAQDDQVLHPVADVKNGLVGEIRHLVETGNRRDHRRGTGGDDEAPRAHKHPASIHRVLVKKTRLGLDHPHAKAGKALDRVVRGDRGDDAMHMIVDPAIVDLGLDDLDAKVQGRAHGFGALARSQQRL